MYLSEICNIVNAMPPHSTGAGLGGVCAYVNMENYSHLTAVIQSGVGDPAVVTVEKSATGVGAGTAIAFTHRDCNVAYLTAGGNTLGVPTLIVGAGGFTMGTNDGNYSVIELDAIELTADYPFVRLALSAVAGVHSVIYILSDARYKEPGIAVSVV
jgi:hypothetical protein